MISAGFWEAGIYRIDFVPARAGHLAGWGLEKGQKQKTLELTGVDNIKIISEVFFFFLLY